VTHDWHWVVVLVHDSQGAVQATHSIPLGISLIGHEDEHVPATGSSRSPEGQLVHELAEPEQVTQLPEHDRHVLPLRYVPSGQAA